MAKVDINHVAEVAQRVQVEPDKVREMIERLNMLADAASQADEDKLEHCRNQERLRALTKSRRVGAARDSAKERAHKVVQRLINSGGLKRKPCVVCGRTPAQAHHEDYSKPECVHWLCCMHHQQIHAGRFSIISRPDVGTGARVKISRK